MRLLTAVVQYGFVLILVFFGNIPHSQAQSSFFWSDQKRIPEYPDFTQEPPFLIADQNNTVHAFNSQALVLDDENSPEAIFYRQWTEETGWSSPNDIIYNSAGGSIEILGAASDLSGMVYIIFQQDFDDIYITYAFLADAANSTAWYPPFLIASQSTQVGIGFEGIAAIAADNEGNVVVIYSGAEFGKGLYSVYSSDYGVNWSDSYPIYLTGDETMVVTDPAIVLGSSGNFHAVWATYLEGGDAGPGYYGSFEPVSKTWSEPIELDVPGVRTPSVIEFGDQLIVSYYHANVNGNWWRLSMDGGISWSLPDQLSPRHVGTNGRVSFVVDSKNRLYAFFGERINEMNHGMWVCTWNGFSWSEPEPVVKGQQIRDKVGGQGFDPRSARAVIRNGNLILITWSTDGFAGENGAWYSYKTLDAPQLPVVANPMPINDISALPTAVVEEQQIMPMATNTSIAVEGLNDNQPSSVWTGPQISILSGVILALILIGGVFFLSVLRDFRKSR